jgi:hypothetical protein
LQLPWASQAAPFHFPVRTEGILTAINLIGGWKAWASSTVKLSRPHAGETIIVGQIKVDKVAMTIYGTLDPPHLPQDRTSG